MLATHMDTDRFLEPGDRGGNYLVIDGTVVGFGSQASDC